ncbi:Abortive infection protein [Pyrobaculum islandicum DSM 4184]|uniref:Abortive infection protein n=1 Tax=Pyrobaculum islandicum (strain DSM 4184 / JCM 9189 / GEO3) TaxID=384616 RepID=A1RTM3_PYRIL|nr:Abortive infection protein [Pyrobaculum islandicum DSM 4184]
MYKFVRLVILALSMPIMFIAMGIAAFVVPICGAPIAIATAYLVLTPVVYYTRGYPMFRLRYFIVSLLMMVVIWALEAAAEPYLREYSRAIQIFIQAMSVCPQWKAYFITTALVLAPLVEETLFRALLYVELEKRAGAVAGYAGSSLAFAMAHGASMLIPLYFALGVVLTYAFKRGGIVSAVVLHSLNNLLALAPIIQ